MNAREVTRAAKAIYESGGFKKPWDHPDTVEIWHRVCHRQARAALTAYLSIRSKRAPASKSERVA
jgi:hypothetical protein